MAKVHKTFECPAVYLPTTPAPAVTGIRIDVRVHAKIAPIENEFIWPGTSPVSELTPRLVFRKDQIAMTRQNAIVVLSATEMYRLGPADPDRFGYYKVEAIRLTAQECQTALAAIGDPAAPEWEGILS